MKEINSLSFIEISLENFTKYGYRNCLLVTTFLLSNSGRVYFLSDLSPFPTSLMVFL
jgi:hypothetical protein